MQVEIPDLDVIVRFVAAFVLGLVVLIIYYKVRPHVNLSRKEGGVRHDPRLEEYERQLVEMKIRVDAMVIGGVSDGVIGTSQVMGVGSDVGDNKVLLEQKKTKNTPKVGGGDLDAPNITHHNAIEFVLHQITTKPKTSRDIQEVLGKSREHTARLLKKLYDDGLVKRNVNSKPYTYSITKAGQERLDQS